VQRDSISSMALASESAIAAEQQPVPDSSYYFVCSSETSYRFSIFIGGGIVERIPLAA
jgi:hypothetical protein